MRLGLAKRSAALPANLVGEQRAKQATELTQRRRMSHEKDRLHSNRFRVDLGLISW